MEDDAIDYKALLRKYKALLRKYMAALLRVEGDVLAVDAVEGLTPLERAALENMTEEVCGE